MAASSASASLRCSGKSNVEAVSQILAERSPGAGGFEKMIGWSVLAHTALLATVALVPDAWLGSRAATEPATVMTISLGGPTGPRDGGMTPMARRPIQAVRPPETKPQPEAVRPPAARAPEMVEPTVTAPRKPSAASNVDAKEPNSRTPTRGEEVRSGSAVAETSARGQGFGLTAGGGGTGAMLDVGNFCCPEYVTTMVELINRNWSSKQQSAGLSLVKFTIERDGTVTRIELERSSGSPPLDFMAQRALTLTRQLPPLPQAFTEPSLTVHMQFQYQR